MKNLKNNYFLDVFLTLFQKLYIQTHFRADAVFGDYLAFKRFLRRFLLSIIYLLTDLGLLCSGFGAIRALHTQMKVKKSENSAKLDFQ